MHISISSGEYIMVMLDYHVYATRFFPVWAISVYFQNVQC